MNCKKILRETEFFYLMDQQKIAPGDYYLIHSSGKHISKSNDGRAIIKNSKESLPQLLTFTLKDNGFYTISIPGNEYLSLKGNYDTFFLNDPLSPASQFSIHQFGSFFIKLECRSNNKFLGTDDTSEGSYVYSDKRGNDDLHYWYITTDPNKRPLIEKVEYIINSFSEQRVFEGWGVSLCWWANMCGKWSDEKIDEIIDWLVSPDQLNFRIFRYNIGGGDDPNNVHCKKHHMAEHKGIRAEMEGFKESSNSSYKWEHLNKGEFPDSSQMKIMLKIKEKRPDAIFEAFSNSPPYYMTFSGCISGNTDKSLDNLKPKFYEEFAHYLVDVCKYYKEVHGIEFRTLEPFNEPMTNYWQANGEQEGCHFDVESQILFLKILHPILKESGLKTVISVSDETSVEQSVEDFLLYKQKGVLDLIDQWNTHTYIADNKNRAKISFLCKEENKRLWMSEVGGGSQGLKGNLKIAQKLIDDMRYIMPSAWIDWQYIEEGNDQWCLVNCSSFSKGDYKKVKNFFVRSHFSRFIKEGYRLISTLDNHTLAARNKEGDRIVIVSINTKEIPVQHTVQIPMYGDFLNEIEAYVTTKSKDMSKFDGCQINKGILTFKLPTISIATLILTHKNSNKNKKFILSPRIQTDLALDVVDGVLRVKKITKKNSQIWSFIFQVNGCMIINSDDEIITEEKSSNYELAAKKERTEGQTFKIEEIDGLFYKIINKDNKALELEGESSSDGTRVGLWPYEDGDLPVHRQWILTQVFETNIDS